MSTPQAPADQTSPPHLGDPSTDASATSGVGGGRAAPEYRSATTWRRHWRWVAGGVVLLLVAIVGVPWVHNALTTASTNDAYVNGHVTFVAARVVYPRHADD